MLASLSTFHQRSEANMLCKFESHQFLSFTHAVGENLSNNSYDISRVGNYQHFQGYFHHLELLWYKFFVYFMVVIEFDTQIKIHESS